MDDTNTEQPVQEAQVEKKDTIKLKLPAFLFGDRNQHKDDWKFGLAFFATILITVFSDILYAVGATVLIFLFYGYLENKGKIA